MFDADGSWALTGGVSSGQSSEVGIDKSQQPRVAQDGI
jgi:hypothetical protein